MKNNSTLKTIITIIVIIVIILAVIYLPGIIKNQNSNNSINDKQSVEYTKNYEVNEYIPIMINDEQMSRIYLSDYMNNVLYNPDKAYDSLNKEYREKKFGSLDAYKNYINSLNLSKSSELDKYATYDKYDYKYYDLYDKDGNRYIFKTNGVMQYEIYLDDYTVDI